MFSLLFPGVWHRYAPAMETGWYEHWIGFDGEIGAPLAPAQIHLRKKPRRHHQNQCRGYSAGHLQPRDAVDLRERIARPCSNLGSGADGQSDGAGLLPHNKRSPPLARKTPMLSESAIARIQNEFERDLNMKL